MNFNKNYLQFSTCIVLFFDVKKNGRVLIFIINYNALKPVPDFNFNLIVNLLNKIHLNHTTHGYFYKSNLLASISQTIYYTDTEF